MYQSISPYTGALLRSFAPHDAQAVGDILQSLKRHRQQHADFFQIEHIAQRAEILAQIGAILSRERRTWALLITQEMGKPIAQALAEVDKCAQLCQHYAQPAQWQPLQSQQINSTEPSPLRGIIAHQPLGIVLQIMPWNFPFWQVLRFAVPAFLAGNSILLKHAPNTTNCAFALEQIWAKAANTSDLFCHIRPDYALLAQLFAHDDIAGIAFTGSNATGSHVAATAGKYTKKSILELGGSDAFLVFDDEDIAAVAEQAAWARLQNNGQTCIAAKRFIIQQSIYKEFQAALVAAVERLRVGNPAEADTQLSTLARADLAQTLRTQVQRAQAEGARLITPQMSAHIDKNDCYFAPQILADVSADNVAAREELFGGVFTLLPAKDEADALRLANASPFGLGASIWTADHNRALRCAHRLDVGAVSINQILRSDARLPFGGVKQSGYGRELGAAGLLEFVNIKSILC